MEGFVGFASTVAAMAVLCTLLEFLVPQGALKGSVRIAAGLLFVLAIAEPMVGIVRESEWPMLPSGTSVEAPKISHEDWLRELYLAQAEEIGQSTE